VKVLYISGAGAGTGDAGGATETQCGSLTPKKKRKGHFAKRVFGKLAFRNDPLHCDRGIRTQGGMRCASTALSRAIYRCFEGRAPDGVYFIAACSSQCDVMPRRQHLQTWRHL